MKLESIFCKISIVSSVFALIDEIRGHGRLMEPPNRSSLWRLEEYQDLDPPVEYNYDDDQLDCGSLGNMVNHGRRCGACGDSYELPRPRDNENGGIYGQGLIVRNYKMGQVIDIAVELTTNNWGYFTWNLCHLENPNLPEPEGCFDKYPLPLADGSGFQYNLTQKLPGWYNTTIKLPSDFHCDQCVLRWQFKTVNFMRPIKGDCVGSLTTLGSSQLSLHSGYILTNLLNWKQYVLEKFKMGILFNPYKPVVYRLVPRFDVAIQKCDKLGLKTKLDLIGQVFVKHNTFRDFGLTIIHRHFDMDDNEILVDSLAEDKGTSIAMPWNIKGKEVSPSENGLCEKYNIVNKEFVHPMTWIFTEFGGIEPFEFQATNEKAVVVPSEYFLKDLFQILTSFGLEKVIGIRRHAPKSWESTPPGVRANVLHFSEAPDEVKSELVTVMWTFNENGKFSVNGWCTGHQCCGHGGGCGCHR